MSGAGGLTRVVGWKTHWTLTPGCWLCLPLTSSCPLGLNQHWTRITLTGSITVWSTPTLLFFASCAPEVLPPCPLGHEGQAGQPSSILRAGQLSQVKASLGAWPHDEIGRRKALTGLRFSALDGRWNHVAIFKNTDICVLPWIFCLTYARCSLAFRFLKAV